MSNIAFLGAMFFGAAGVTAEPPERPLKEPEPRWCCALGWGPALDLISTTTKPLRLQTITGHDYGGTGYIGLVENYAGVLQQRFVPSRKVAFPQQGVSKDPVGYIYTSRGGIIDIGHVRGLADRAMYFSSRFMTALETGESFEIYSERGARVVRITQTVDSPSAELASGLGARLAWQTAVWHEVATFFTWEQYSSFSPEDSYSNLLGCLVGARAFMHAGPDPDGAINEVLKEAIEELGPQPAAVTKQAVSYVEDVWYRDNRRYDIRQMPRFYDDYRPRWSTAPLRAAVRLELLARAFDVEGSVSPWLVTDAVVPGKAAQKAALLRATRHPLPPKVLPVPTHGPDGEELSSYFQMEVDVDHNIVPESFLQGMERPIRGAHLQTMVQRLEHLMLAYYPESDQPHKGTW